MRNWLTFGTAAWKFMLDAALAPVTWNLTRIFTMPGRCAFTCGVSVILESSMTKTEPNWRLLSSDSMELAQ